MIVCYNYTSRGTGISANSSYRLSLFLFDETNIVKKKIVRIFFGGGGGKSDAFQKNKRSIISHVIPTVSSAATRIFRAINQNSVK